MSHRSILGVAVRSPFAFTTAISIAVATAATVSRLLLVPAQFSATATFALGGSLATSSAAGLAEQLGFASGAAGDRGVDYYLDLLRNEGFLERIAAARIPNAEGELVEITSVVGITRGHPRRRVERATRKLRRSIVVTANRRSGIVTVTARSRDSVIAAELANLVVAIADSTNITSRAIRGRSEREFLEVRAAVADSSLRAAQDRLATYISSNRAYESDAFQRAAVARLQFAVEVAQQLKLELARSLEAARLEEVRNTPVIGVLFPARTRSVADGRGSLVFFVSVIVIGWVGCCGLLFATIPALRERAAAALRVYTRLSA
jgi:uncharacterized protein involved in exopolysaccharide biosynthesis